MNELLMKVIENVTKHFVYLFLMEIISFNSE